jgi:hypothetical protein
MRIVLATCNEHVFVEKAEPRKSATDMSYPLSLDETPELSLVTLWRNIHGSTGKRNIAV